MKISFDIDDTLIPSSQNGFPTCPRNAFQKLVGIEKIRIGTIELFKLLLEKGHEVGVYTTSFRSIIKLKIWCLSYGVNPSFIINQKINYHYLKKSHLRVSKYPPAFGIDIHIDDSAGVELEGKKYDFKTIIVDPNDLDWVNNVMHAINVLQLH